MDELAKQINEAIKNSEIYQRYSFNKNSVENNEKLVKIRQEMKELKDLNCKNKNEEMISRYYELEKQYSSSLIVKEYEISKKELYDLLVEVCDILWFK